jgi:hypothetical protein
MLVALANITGGLLLIGLCLLFAVVAARTGQ